MEGAPASPEVAEVLDRRDVAGFDSRSLPLSTDMIEKADLVLVMTRGHLAGIHAMVGGGDGMVENVHLLDPSGDVQDPIGGGPEIYEATARQIEEIIPTRLGEFLA